MVLLQKPNDLLGLGVGHVEAIASRLLDSLPPIIGALTVEVGG